MLFKIKFLSTKGEETVFGEIKNSILPLQTGPMNIDKIKVVKRNLYTRLDCISLEVHIPWESYSVELWDGTKFLRAKIPKDWVLEVKPIKGDEVRITQSQLIGFRRVE